MHTTTRSSDPSDGRRTGRRGVGLVDVLVGLSLITMGFLICMNALPMSGRALRAAQTKLVATHVAEQQLELAAAQPFDTLASLPPSPIPMTTVVRNTAQTVTYTTQVNAVQISQNLYDVTCTVTWRDNLGAGPVRQVFLETMVARRP